MLPTIEKINLPCIPWVHSDREQGRVRSSKNSVWNTYSPLSLSLFPIMNAYITMLPTTEKINLLCIPGLHPGLLHSGHSDRKQGRVRSSKNSVWNTYSPLSLSLFPIMNAYITMLPTTEKINLPCIPWLYYRGFSLSFSLLGMVPVNSKVNMHPS